MTFLEFLRSIAPEDTPRGDFAAAALGDRQFPDVVSWDQLAKYLRGKGACREAVAAGRLVWRAYEARRDPVTWVSRTNVRKA